MRTTTRADAELLLRHLADHDVRVVAVGRDDDGVGILDARPRAGAGDPSRARRGTRRPSRRPAGRAPPRARRSTDTSQPASPQLQRDRGADAAAAHDDHLHATSVAQRRARPFRTRRAPRRARAAGTRRSAPRTARAGARSRPSARRSATGGASAARSRARSGRRSMLAARGRRSRGRSRARGSCSCRPRRRAPRRAAAPPRATPRRAPPLGHSRRRARSSIGTRITWTRLDPRAVLAARA